MNQQLTKKLTLHRKTTFWAGFFYLLSFASIPTLFLYAPLHNPNFVSTVTNNNKIVIGGILEIIVTLSCIMSSTILYPVLKKQNHTLALSLIASRILEASTIFVGVAFLLASVSLQQVYGGDGAVYNPMANTLVLLYDRIFSIGQGFLPAINDILLGVLLYQSRLVPRGLALIGIVGAVPLILGFLAIIFGIIDRTSPLAALSAVMVALFEFSLGIYFLVKSMSKA